jgi:glycosyltransferase involved in cell wall biosynthesis
MPLDELREAPQISVILPAFNEEKTIGSCIKDINEVLKANGLFGEIIVSDSSTDRTPEIAESLGATVVHPKKRGYGHAYLEAFDHAHAPYVVMLDSDGTYDPGAIPEMIERLSGGADLVIGSRFKGTIHKGAMTPLHRYIGNPLLTGILNAVFHTRYSDAHSGFRAIRREALEELHLTSGGMEFASEMLAVASIKGLVIDEVPISYYQRLTPSNLHTFADGWRHLRFIVLMRPVPFLAFPGLIFSISGAMLMIWFTMSGNIEMSHLNAFILGAILLIGGIQMIVMSVNTEVYSIIHGYSDKSRFMSVFLTYHSLEKFLVVGGVLIVSGLALGFSIVFNWVTEHFGMISRISPSVVALVLIIIGMQVISCSIFLSMMLLNNGDSE